MTTLNPDKLEALIKQCLNDFHERRIKTLEKLNLRKVLRRKNPYLFKALGTEQAAENIKKILGGNLLRVWKQVEDVSNSLK